MSKSKKKMSMAWNRFVAAVSSQVPDAAARQFSPASRSDILVAKKGTDDLLPPSLEELYSVTGGLEVAGFLPDKFTDDDLTFSILPLSEVLSYYRGQMDECKIFGGIWCFVPSFLRVTALVKEPGEGLWNPAWIPFAWDGAGNLQFVSGVWPFRIFQYNHESADIKLCGKNLISYLNSVAAKIETGEYSVED